MPVLTSSNLLLLPTTRAMMSRRLESAPFSMSCAVEGGVVEVFFPESWPGDALGIFARQLADEVGDPAGSFTAVLRDELTAVGQLGTKGSPDAAGAQEIGYGFSPEHWGRGFATEAVGALAAHLLALPAVVAVSAETAVWNVASGRVLEKSGFARTGTAVDASHGDVVRWERR